LPEVLVCFGLNFGVKGEKYGYDWLAPAGMAGVAFFGGIQQMNLKTLMLGATAAVVLAGTAGAGFERDGWYVGLEGGGVAVQDFELDGQPVTIELDNGWAVLATVGYAWADSNWRLEGELGYRSNEGQTSFYNEDAELEEWSGMINAVYDFKLNSDKWGLSVGAGVGVDNPRFSVANGLLGDDAESKDTVFAYQAIAGVTYRLNQHWDLALNYRYFNASDAELRLFSGDEERDGDLNKHTVTIGFRYGYDEPPAPPAEPPVVIPPPQPKQFVVFFGWNKSNITAEADAVLAEAAAAAKSSGSASIRVVGHTDTSGSNAYNQRLSEARANAVKANLVGKGISDGSISTSGKGEGELMVQTGDGVKEPQNRRATVDMN
jgi:outer membrane protein OmpA-like peptidoglycan-associated protein